MKTQFENLAKAFIALFKSVFSLKNNQYSLFDLWSAAYSFTRFRLEYKVVFRALCSTLETILLGTNVYEVYIKSGGYTRKYRWYHNFLYDNPKKSVVKYVYATTRNLIPLFSKEILKDQVQIAIYFTKESMGKRFLISFDTIDLKHKFVDIEDYIHTENPINLLVEYHEMVYELFEDFVCDNGNWGDNTIMVDRPATYNIDMDIDTIKKYGRLNDRDKGQFILPNTKCW